jgi:hypothetical protein
MLSSLFGYFFNIYNSKIDELMIFTPSIYTSRRGLRRGRGRRPTAAPRGRGLRRGRGRQPTAAPRRRGPRTPAPCQGRAREGGRSAGGDAWASWSCLCETFSVPMRWRFIVNNFNVRGNSSYRLESYVRSSGKQASTCFSACSINGLSACKSLVQEVRCLAGLVLIGDQKH